MPTADGPPPTGPETTELLRRWRGGDAEARDRLVERVYDELRALARRALAREAGPRTIEATALVHEAYLRLMGDSQVEIQDRGHFFAVAARVMRNILVDHARARNAQRRGGGARQVELDTDVGGRQPDVDMLALDEALARLEAVDRRKCQVVEMKFFAGLTEQEIAGVLGVGRATVERDWAFARSWLQIQMAPGSAPPR
jgi:RNA polymerase sigma factor (TIGR02999 family)